MTKRPRDFEEKVKKFVKVNLHKGYGLSLSKLIRFKDVVYEDPQDQKKRTFFCSELVAALYKYCNILEKEKASSRYIPKDFTDAGSIVLINQAALEPERKLVFKEELLREDYRFIK